MRFNSPALQLVGVVACLVGLVGYVAFGWRFDSSGGPLVTAVAVVCVALAVGVTVWRSMGRS